MRDHWFSFKDACIVVWEKEKSPFFSGLAPGHSVFFLHGRSGSAQGWESVMIGLSRYCRCFAIDFPSFGRSELIGRTPFSLPEYVKLVIQVIGQMSFKDEPVILVGYDVGAGIAQICALQVQERISGLIMINPTVATERLQKQSFGFFRRFHPWVRACRELESTWPAHYQRQVWRRLWKESNFPTLYLWGEGPEPHLGQPQWVISQAAEFMIQLEARTLTLASVQKSLSR